MLLIQKLSLHLCPTSPPSPVDHKTPSPQVQIRACGQTPLLHEFHGLDFLSLVTFLSILNLCMRICDSCQPK